jgi:GNAT superfamily N-acetyltransferase
MSPNGETLLDPADIYGDEPGQKVRTALERFRLESIREAEGPGFEEVYGVLHAEFAARGELERRAVIASRLRGPAEVREPPLFVRYHLVAARDGDGALAGVRDLCVSVDRRSGRCVVYLAHTLVLPRFRRTGLGALLRAVPATLARREVADLGFDPESVDILLAGEMEPADPRARETVIRLLAYGHAGFVVIPPALLPYCQPDFRDLAATGEEPRPIPLLAVVRWLGHETRRTLPMELAEAYVRQLYAIYSIHSRPEDLEEALEHSLKTLRSSGLEKVPLMRLPAGPEELRRVRPLLRSAVLPLFPASLRGFLPPPAQDPDQEMEALLQAWPAKNP